MNDRRVGDLALVPARPLLAERPTLRIPLAPGDRPLVGVGDAVAQGDPVVERLRDPRIELVTVTTPVAPGSRVDVPGGEDGAANGEVLFVEGDRARVVVADHVDVVGSPGRGTVRSIRAGIELTIEAAGVLLPATLALGVPTTGRLAIATDEGGELRPGSLDVGRAGSILVVGSRVDAETLTRARAMGVRGIVVEILAAKEERDFGASERRQRAALHQLPPFAVLVLDGAIRRPIPSIVMSVLRGLDGRDVGISLDPPGLLVDEPIAVTPAPDRIRVRSGPLSGREGRWHGAAGLRRFPAGVHLEAGFVRFDDGTLEAVPLADLERFV